VEGFDHWAAQRYKRVLLKVANRDHVTEQRVAYGMKQIAIEWLITEK